MNEQEGFEITSFTVVTPPNCALGLDFEESDATIDRILDELRQYGVKEICHYAEFLITVDRDYDMTMQAQYALVVDGLKRILKV